MSNIRLQRHWVNGLLGAAAFLALVASGAALADPPSRVARLTQISGTVSFSPAGEEDWAFAQANRPLITGDRIWADAGSRAELQIGRASVRLGAETSMNILNLDDRTAQFQLAQGELNVRVRYIAPDQAYEVDTPNLAFSITRPGEYRIDVDPAGDSTTLRVLNGEGQAWGEGVAYVIAGGQQYTFFGAGLRDYQTAALPPPDDFDRWAFDRNRREDNAVAARYVSPDVIGYSDLDEYGEWRPVEGYGAVWFPTSVAAGWAPYRDGHWAWVEPWGWTWIDEAPWGFAPFHYGRWAYVSSRWCWVPGPVRARPVYAPALVAFVGGAGGVGISLSFGPAVAWFPLGPGEVYRPAYSASRTYFTNVNVTNTVVNTTVINNVYNNVNVTNVVYRNREVAGAVTAVPTTTFAGGQPVARAAVAVPREVVAKERVVSVAAVAPSHTAVMGVSAAAAAGAAVAATIKRPPEAALARPVIAKTAPAPLPPSFASKASLLAAQPGKPLEAEKLSTVSPARARAERNVKLAAPAGVAAPAPKQLPPSRQAEERKGPPQASTAPQPPKGQERVQEERKGPAPQANVAPQPPKGQERIQEERKGPPPQANVAPQPPKGQERIQEERKGPPPQANAAPQPPKGQARVQEERKGPPPQASAAPQPPTSAQVRQPQGAQQQRAGKPESIQDKGKAREKDKEKSKDKEKEKEKEAQ